MEQHGNAGGDWEVLLNCALEMKGQDGMGKAWPEKSPVATGMRLEMNGRPHGPGEVA
jgi:hypothetical protein